MEYSIDPGSRARQTDYRRIADNLRADILSGKLAKGARLPSTKELAGKWKCSAFTLHKAMVTLVKEGWVDRLHGEGTFVSGSAHRFVCAGIYYETDIASEDRSPFLRRLHASLLDQFRQLKKETLVFVDSRPRKDQRPLLPALAEAILKRRIQCLVAPTPRDLSWPALNKMTLPLATLDTRFRGCADLDNYSLLRGGVRRLIAQGCRSIGLISHITPSRGKSLKADDRHHFYSLFRQAIHEEGSVTRAEWIRHPVKVASDFSMEVHGYTEFKNLWNLPEIPDGLIVFPDAAAKGVIMAILEIGMARVLPKMKFVFHRNAHGRLLCPFPVTWAISDEDLLAAKLIQQIQHQFNGQEVHRILQPYTFKEA